GAIRRIEDTSGGLLLEAPVNPAGATFPDALGGIGTALLYADDDSSTLLEVPLSNLAVRSAEAVQLANVPNAGTTQLFVEPSDGGSRLYAMNSSAQTLAIFAGPSAADAGQLLAGGAGALGLVSLGGMAFDPGSSPEPCAKLGSFVFVPLNATGKVLKVDVSDPAHPQKADTYDLQPLVSGSAPDGGPFSPSPTQAIARNGFVYVA